MPRQVPASSLVITSQRVVATDEQGALVVRPAAIFVSGARIERVEPLDAAFSAAATDTAVRHDFGDRIVAPAYVNAHTHLALCALRGVTTALARRGNVVSDVFFRFESLLTEGDVRAFTRLGAYECLLAGTGEVWDHYYFGQAVAEALSDVGLGGVVAPTLQDLSGPGHTRWESELDATERLATRRDLAERGIFAALGPHATDTVSAGLFANIGEVARRLELPVHMHVAQSFEEVDEIRARENATPVEYLERSGVLTGTSALLAHGVFASRADLARLDPTRHRFAVCPFSQVQFAFPTPVEELARAGLSFVVGTDCVASNDSMSLAKELSVLAGMSALRAASSRQAEEHLERGTLESARTLNDERKRRLSAWGDETGAEQMLSHAFGDRGRLGARGGSLGAGVIAPGALAHIAVYDPEHPCLWPADDPLRALAYADVGPALHTLIVGGRVVGRVGELFTSLVESAEYRETVREATRRRALLLARLDA